MRHVRSSFGLVALAVASLVLAGCGSFARSDSVAPPTTQGPDEEVGSGIGRRSTTTTAAPRVTTTAKRGATTTTAVADPRCPPPPANTNRTTHAESGFAVGVFVADRTCFTRDEPFALSLSVVNTTKSTRYHDPNQSEFFEITGNGRRWSDRSCLPPQEQFEAGPSELGAGREAIFDARYPVPERSDRSGDACRLPPGQYQVVGILEWCPPAANSDGYCSPQESQPIRTPPVRIRIG